ncbi:MAG: AmmeMemoRadiSam system protein A [Anaerolineae bacterium]|nr:AmmeMemoRadiSam system protein A [Anaerolineae bacterium]
MTETYTPDEQTLLLTTARHTLEAITSGQDVPLVDVTELPDAVTAERACFVTLRRHEDGSLRGCTGTLTARRPLIQEVIQMTIQTARHDPRFYPVEAHEVEGLHLEISVLTPPEPLAFAGPDDLLDKLRPGIDGVTLNLGTRRATFLPQVWDSYPDPVVFLSLLSDKMGRPNAWRDPQVEVQTYQAVIIEEAD